MTTLMMKGLAAGTLPLILLTCCSLNGNQPPKPDPDPEPDSTGFYYGADLSYVNEMEDCGAEYFNKSGVQQDPYAIFQEAGTNLVRLRLWHNPEWTDYSNLADVTKSIRRAKTLGIRVLLDFHYSDDWADPAKQEIPAAWEGVINNTPRLADSLYNYTYQTLMYLHGEGLLPEMVQVGNEINGMILQKGELKWPIDWTRNATLLNRGLKAVRDVSKATGKDIEVMLHIAQPENALWWFEQATANNVRDYDWIGLSYYPLWSDYQLDNVAGAFTTLKNTYKKRLMVVETAYPFTMENNDPANNILNNEALIDGYPASPQGQLDYLMRLQAELEKAGGEGLIYWEPAWVSTNCRTQWGTGSHWDNATLFDHQNRAMVGMDFYNGSKAE